MGNRTSDLPVYSAVPEPTAETRRLQNTHLLVLHYVDRVQPVLILFHYADTIHPKHSVGLRQLSSYQFA